MTIEKKNPNATTVTASSNAITEINDRINREETANHGVQSFTETSTSRMLTSAQFWGSLGFIHNTGSPAPGGAFTLTVPGSSEERGAFIVVNNTGQTMTVTISGQSETAPTVEDGSAGVFYSDGTNVYGITGGAADFLSLTDSPSSYSSQGGKHIAVNSGETAIEFVSEKYDIPLSYAGTPTGGEVLGRLVIPRTLNFAANFATSYGYVGTNPSASYVISVQDDGSEIGTITISTGGAFTFATTSGTAKTVAAGSRLDFVAPSPSPAEATVANIAATLAGTI